MSNENEREDPSMDELWARTGEGNSYEERTDALMEISMRLRANKEIWASQAAAQSALDLYEQNKDQNQIGHVLMLIAKNYAQLKEFENALDAFSRAGECFQTIADDQHRGDALRLMGNVYDDLSKPAEAALVRRDAITILASAESYTLAGIAALDLGESQGRDGRQSEALETFKQAFKYFQDADDLTGSVRANDRIAAALIDLGQMDEALDHLRDALAIAEYIQDIPRANWGRYRLGWTLVTVAKYAEALPLLETAIAAYKAEGNFENAANCDLQRAHAFNAMGDYTTALRLYQTAHAVFIGLGDKSSALMAHVNVGENLQAVGNLNKAKAAFYECLEEAISIKDEWLERAIRIRLSEVELVLENVEAALSAIENSDPTAWGEELLQRARHLNAHANALVASSRLDEARVLLEQVITLNVNQTIPKETAVAYELLIQALPYATEDEKSQLAAQAVALYLASGFVAEATELSKLFVPADNTQVVQMLRREFRQPDIFDEDEEIDH